MQPMLKNRSSKLPSWDLDPNKLLVGVEQEYFIFTKNGRAPTLDQIKDLLEKVTVHGFAARRVDDDGRPLMVNRDTSLGYVSIKNDFATHVIEGAFPPCSTPSELAEIFTSTWDILRAEADKTGLILKTNGLIDAAPENMTLVPHERREWLPSRKFQKSHNNFAHKFFNVLMCSTQVHLNILDSNFYSNLETYYSTEFLIPLLFANSKSSIHKDVYCVRPLMWRDSFAQEYKVFAIPESIPNSEESYCALLESAYDFKRDYSFIAPRRFGSVEFRTACAQSSVRKVLELAALRIAISIAISQGHVAKIKNFREVFYETCMSGEVDQGLLSNILNALLSARKLIPSNWRPFLDTSLAELWSKCER